MNSDPKNTDHLYITDPKHEKLNSYKQIGAECYVFKTQLVGTVPLQRFYNKRVHNHFYCINPSKEKLRLSEEWRKEKDMGYVFPSKNQSNRRIKTAPLHRYFNKEKHDHFYTLTKDIEHFESKGYKYESIECYVPARHYKNTTALTLWVYGEAIKKAKPAPILEIENMLKCNLAEAKTINKPYVNEYFYQKNSKGNINGLSLRGADLSDIKFLEQLSDLKKLYLSKNQISDLSPLKNMTDLDGLWLGSNQISDLSPLKNMTTLKGLSLYSNQISDLSPLKNMTTLKFLSLNSNQISDLSPLKNITALKNLSLDSNQISDLSPLKNVKALKELSLDSNQVSDLSPLEEMKFLEELDLSENQISDLSPIKGMKALKFLGLSHNNISELSPLQGLTVLVELDLSENQISDLTHLSGMKALEELDLSENQIDDLSPLNSLTALVYLWLEDNQISNLSPLKSLTALEELDLSENQITNISILFGLEKLSSVELKDNPVIKELPKEEVEAGWAALRNYLLEQMEGSKKFVEIPEVKVLFLGNTTAGKSTLLHYIDKGRVSKSIEKTHGIQYKVITKSVGGKNIKLHCWDFGGQEYFHATHKLFFSPGALHLLLWNEKVSKEVDKDRDNKAKFELEYWLRCVDQLLGNETGKERQSVLVVENKLDESTKSDDSDSATFIPHLIDQKTRAEKFEDLQLHFTAINLRPKKFLKGFMELFKEKIQALPILQKKRPEYYQDYLNTIRTATKKKAVLNVKEINVVDKKKLMPTLKVFHNMGFLLYFPEILPDKVFVNPQELLDLLYESILTKEAKDNNGRLSIKEIKEAIQGNKLDLEHEEVIKLIQHFDLGFQIQESDDNWFFPQYLKQEEQGWIDFLAKHHFSIANVRISSDAYLMNLALLKLFSEYGKHVKKTDEKEYMFWKDGIVIEKDGQVLLVRFNREKQFFELYGDKEGNNIFLQIEVITFIVNLNKQEEKRYEEQKAKGSKTEDEVNKDSAPIKPFKNWESTDFDIGLTKNGKQWILWRTLKKSKVAVVENDKNETFLYKDFKRYFPENKNIMKKIFISYSKKDLKQVNKFIDHLSTLKRNRLVESWYCTDLEPGDKWEDKIKKKFDEADIVCFMLSSNFTKTDYIYDHEIPRAFKRYEDENDNIAIVPILLNFCDWQTEEYNLGDFNGLPYTLIPVSDFDNEELAWWTIIESLKKIIKNPALSKADKRTELNEALKSTWSEQMKDIFERIVDRKV